jgi:chromosome segregation ATPase
VNKHQRELEAISLESQEKKLQVQRLQNELKEFQDNKYSMKGRLEDYEDKIKRMIKEFEEESKRHIKEVNDIHYQYRGYKTKSQELEQRIDQYKSEASKAQENERKATKNSKLLTFKCDELEEKLRYTEQKYHALIKRMGASQQDIDHIEEEIMFKNKNYYNRNSRLSGHEPNNKMS